MLVAAGLPSESGEVAAHERFEEAFGEVLRELRLEAGRSQEELAASAELSTYYLRELEYGRKSATLASVVRIAKALGCAPHDLVARAEQRWKG